MVRHVRSLTRLRFTRADYHCMGDAGIIRPNARVELLDRANCFVRSPLALDDHSEPEPDVMLVEPRSDFYLSALPTPTEVLLLIEVADSTVNLDLGDKLRLYARAGVAEYWVFDLPRKMLIVHTDPVDQQYKSIQEHDRSAEVTPKAFKGLAVDLNGLLVS